MAIAQPVVSPLAIANQSEPNPCPRRRSAILTSGIKKATPPFRTIPAIPSVAPTAYMPDTTRDKPVIAALRHCGIAVLRYCGIAVLRYCGIAVLRQVVERYPRYGFRKLFFVLRRQGQNKEMWGWNLLNPARRHRMLISNASIKKPTAMRCWIFLNFCLHGIVGSSNA